MMQLVQFFFILGACGRLLRESRLSVDMSHGILVWFHCPGFWAARMFDGELVSPRMLPLVQASRQAGVGTAAFSGESWCRCPFSGTTLFEVVKSFSDVFQDQRGNKEPKLESSEASWLGQRGAGVWGRGRGRIAVSWRRVPPRRASRCRTESIVCCVYGFHMDTGPY